MDGVTGNIEIAHQLLNNSGISGTATDSCSNGLGN